MLSHQGNIAYRLASVHMRLIHDWEYDQAPGEAVLDVI